MILIAPAVTAEYSMELKCLVSHLRYEGINEELLSAVESVSNSTFCMEIIDANVHGLYEKIGLKEENRKFSGCFRKGIEESGLKNAYLLAQAVKMFDVGWKIWKMSAQQERYTQLAEIVTQGFEVIQDKCNDVLIKQNFGEDFDKVIYKRKQYRGDHEYCVRKHLVEKGILNPYSYNVVINPQKVKENAIDCSNIITSLQSTTYFEMRQFVPECRIIIYKQENYMEYYMKVEFVLPQLDLLPQEIAKEREDFIDKLYNIQKDSREKCAN